MPPNKPKEPTPASRGKEKVKFAEKKVLRAYDPQYEHTVDRKWNIIGLPVLGTLLLALGLALIIIGAVHDINDLIILGSIFLCGCVMFYVLMYLTVCRPLCQRNVVETYEFADRASASQPLNDVRPQSPDAQFGGYYNSSFDANEDLVQSKSRSTPTEDQLYGNRMRSFMATPATTAGVKLYDDGSATPPPPRLALPSEPGDNKDAVFTMDVNKEMKKHIREVSNLELL